MQRYPVDQGDEVAGRLVAITVDMIGQPVRQMIVPVAADCAVEAAERGIEEGRGSHTESEPPTLDGGGVGGQHRGEHIDAVLLDLTMPEMDGAETFHALRERLPHLPVVLCSGYSKDEVRRHFERAKAPKLVEKPFSPNTLIDAIREALGEDEEA